MTRSTGLRAFAVAGALALALTACSSSDSGTSEEPSETRAAGSTDALVIGTLLPQTGSLAFLGPPEIAGVNLAVEEINEAGGVLGNDVTVEHADSSDADHAEVATQSVTDLLGKGVQVIIGAASSSVTRNVVDDITNAEVVQISPANTATDLSGRDPFYFRTAPSDLMQGAALGNLILGDGHTNVGALVFNEDYGTSLRDVLKATVEDAGGSFVYGNAGEEFDPTEQNYSTIVSNALAAKPDALAIIAFEQTKLIVPELKAQGFDTSKLYFVDGNLSDYSADLEPGTLTGVQGTLPGAFPDDAFQTRLKEVDPELKDFSYAAESYDATILAALAAVKGGGTDGKTIQANLAAVSGANGGTEVSTFEEGVEALEAGDEITYKAVSGAGPFNDDNDPSSAFIGIYKYGEDNKYTWIKAEFGEL
ncbi:ABC transporter substrate-binding protein [Cellulomonas cellasea]|uniref:ABC transporter substrate-binding protein n=2 Tax=Cellulomonas cellasea TaxID=43670 RepID=A0A0A0BAS2_9CELL|nr:ABC transporter substrate-binding protein [Cellulomonas cellasea]KGM03930.1 ABC transporter substrate-binding protein [Cellulomonas cellasea DSM 20118]GEA89048.1 branched-chain amino acid ABC transporter substrate-binding protein [Cellulomonas cellasea]